MTVGPERVSAREPIVMGCVESDARDTVQYVWRAKSGLLCYPCDSAEGHS